MNDYQKAINGNSTGYRIAKKFYGWMNLSKYEEQTMSPCIVRLAEMIDKEIS